MPTYGQTRAIARLCKALKIEEPFEEQVSSLEEAGVLVRKLSQQYESEKKKKEVVMSKELRTTSTKARPQKGELTKGEDLIPRRKWAEYGIRDECALKAFPVYHAHEYAHLASEAVHRKDWRVANIYLELISVNIEKAGDTIRYRAKDYPTGNRAFNDLMISIEQADEHIIDQNTTAILPLDAVKDITKELMFTIACSCETAGD